MREVLCSTENSPFLIIDHIHAKINRVCCAALAIGKRCMNVRKNKLFQNGPVVSEKIWFEFCMFTILGQDEVMTLTFNTYIPS